MIKPAPSLCFISLSILSFFFDQNALAANAIPLSVENLRKIAVDLNLKKQPEEAVERMKDATCLAELLKVPVKDEIEFLQATADTTDSAVQTGLARQPAPLRIYCFKTILGKIPLDSVDELSILQKAWNETHEISASKIESLQAGVAALDAQTREQKRAQALMLINLNPDRPRSAKYLEKALDISEQLVPLDLDLEKQVLAKIVSPKYHRVSADDLKLMRRAVQKEFELPRKDIDTYTESALNTLVLHENLASLVSLCELQADYAKQWLPQNPEAVAPYYLYLGWAYLEADRITDARRIFAVVNGMTKSRSECDGLFECSLVSLAKTEMRAGRLAEARSRLLELQKFMDSPGRGDLFHYGAIGEALMGEIFELEGNLEAARTYYEKSENGLMVMDRTGSNEYSGIRGIKNLVPDDAFVQSRLAGIYKKLNLPDKQKIAQENLLKINQAKKLESRDEHVLSQKIFAASYFPRQEVITALKEYKPYLESSEKDTKKLAAKLNRVAFACLSRGLSEQAEPYLDLAQNIDADGGLHDIIKRNQAWVLSLRGEYAKANQILNAVTTGGTSSADEKFVANWLYARNLMSQGCSKPAAITLAHIVQNWKPGHYRQALYMQACCDQAQWFVKQGKLTEAETCLKTYLSQPTTSFDSESSIDENFGSINYPLALLSKVQALSKKTAESKINYAAASKPDRNRPQYGVLAATVSKTLADAALALHDEARARRLYYEAYEKFNELDGYQSQAKDCAAQIETLLPSAAQ